MARKARVEYWGARNGKFYFHRKATNGKITDPSQGYSGPSTTNVRKAIQRRWPNIEMVYLGRA